jgi:hypothetical protein
VTRLAAVADGNNLTEALNEWGETIEESPAIRARFRWMLP